MQEKSFLNKKKYNKILLRFYIAIFFLSKNEEQKIIKVRM